MPIDRIIHKEQEKNWLLLIPIWGCQLQKKILTYFATLNCYNNLIILFSIDWHQLIF